MKSEKLSEEQIQEALSYVDLDEDELMVRIGSELVPTREDETIIAQGVGSDLLEYGRRFTTALRHQLYYLLCDPRQQVPKSYVTQLVSGDARNLIVAIYGIVESNFNTGTMLGLYSSGLIAKQGLDLFCANPPRGQIKETAQQILNKSKILKKRNRNR